jgi:hypothetical protein
VASDRVRVIHQEKQLGRVGNWKFCVSHFVDSGAAWMKFLPAGDRHKPDSLAICRRALAERPEARFMLVNVELVCPDRREPWTTARTTMLLTPAQAMREVAERGNVFHSLQAALVHVDAVRGGFAFGEDTLSYCADLLFLMNIARRHTTYYYPELVTEFVVENRRTFKVGQFTLAHFVEEAHVRMQATEHYQQLTGDRPGRDRLLALVAQWLRQGLAQSPT